MHKDLISDAFEKARADLQQESGIDPSTLQMALRISGYLDEEHHVTIGDRSIRDYYREAQLEEQNDTHFRIARPEVVKSLCAYLGFESYDRFVHERSEKKNVIYNNGTLEGKAAIAVTPKNKKLFAWFSNATAANKKYMSILILVIAVGAAGTFSGIYLFSEKTRWMIWNDNHYEEVSFDQDQLSKGLLKLYKEDRILYFKKVDSLDCDDEFFNADGSVKIWYGKNPNGDLEYFTDLGLHPETGKTLKPITKYMIRTHVCDSIEN